VICDFALEVLTPDVWGEAAPLLIAHWKEVAHFADIPLAPDFAFYDAAVSSGVLRFYSIRGQGRLVGYAVFFVKPNPHYTTSVQAAADVLYLSPECRGHVGRRFIRWCDDQLRAEGVQAVYHRTKATRALNFAPILERQGYTLIDLVYAKRLDTIMAGAVDGRDGRAGQSRGGDDRPGAIDAHDGGAPEVPDAREYRGHGGHEDLRVPSDTGPEGDREGDRRRSPRESAPVRPVDA